MKALICKINFLDVFAGSLLLRIVGAGFSVAPVLTGIAVGIYLLLVLGNLLKKLARKISTSALRRQIADQASGRLTRNTPWRVWSGIGASLIPLARKLTASGPCFSPAVPCAGLMQPIQATTASATTRKEVKI